MKRDRWRANRESFANVSGVHSLYVSTTGPNGANLAIGSFRLLKAGPPPTDLLTVKVSPAGAPALTSQVGDEDWTRGYDEISFTTGPAATAVEVEVSNGGRVGAYLDRIYLIEGYPTRGGEPRDVSTGKSAELLLDPSTTAPADAVVDGIPDNETLTGDHPGSWIQVDLEQMEPIHGIRLTPPSTQLARMSNFRVSVWSADPNAGGIEVWGQDYLTDGNSLGADETLALLSTEMANDGETELGTVAGRFVRVQLLGVNNSGDHQLALGELQVFGFDETNVAQSDGMASQSSTESGAVASLAIDNDNLTYAETQASDVDSWWKLRFPQPLSIGEIELVSREGGAAGDLSNFTVSVWDEDPDGGGTKIWEQAYFASGGVGQGQSLVIGGSEVGTDRTTRLATAHRGRVVRVQLDGVNNAGNGTLALANVRVVAADVAEPKLNAALNGIASQSSDFYGDVAAIGFAKDANDGVISPITNFTSTLNESGASWQVDLGQATPIEQIVVFNREDAANRLNNFRVSVWNDDPQNGGTELWGRTYNYSSSAPFYSTSAITAGGALLVNGDVLSGGTRLDEVTEGQFVQVELQGSNILSLAEVQVWTTAPPLGPGDVDGINGVTLADFEIIRQNFLTSVTQRTEGDLTGDGFVDFDDFRQWKQNYPSATAAAATAPLGAESSTAAPGHTVPDAPGRTAG